MAAPHSVDPAQLVAEQHLAAASPDVLRQMVTTMANAMMSAQADQVCGAEYGERSAAADQPAQRLPGPGLGHPRRHRRARGARSCATAPTSRTGC